MKHIRRARKTWTCTACSAPIEIGERHFCTLGITLPYGRYIGTMVEARYHLACASPELACCDEGQRELRASVHP